MFKEGYFKIIGNKYTFIFLIIGLILGQVVGWITPLSEFKWYFKLLIFCWVISIYFFGLFVGKQIQKEEELEKNKFW